MIYRRKTYIVDSSFVEEFNALFNDILLPSQLKYGARLIGRWHLEVDVNTSEIFALYMILLSSTKRLKQRLKRMKNMYKEFRIVLIRLAESVLRRY